MSRYELLPRDTGVLGPARGAARRARRRWLPRRQHHGAVQGVGLADRRPMRPTRWSVPASRTRCSSARPARRNAFNTDFSGFKWAYRRHFANASPGTVALLGAGGVGTATAAALVDLGASAIRIYDVLPERSHALADMLRHRNDSHPGGRRGVGRRGCRRRRRGRQRNSCRDVPPTRHARRSRRDRATSSGSSTPSTRRSRPS